MNPYNPYWIPKFKWQLVEWLLKYHPGTTSSYWNHKSKSQLYAIYHSIRSKSI